MRNVSAAEANRHFSKLLRDVQSGETLTVTSHGRPVAVIQPMDSKSAGREAAKKRLLQHLTQQKPMGRGFRRDELYDEDEA
ncbi:Prevent-host-death family protein [Rhodospirillaceae bacterium LM-1]|nr:Prevent-host-death family protein [Rhodospirillaceae bacterium LM-1]